MKLLLTLTALLLLPLASARADWVDCSNYQDISKRYEKKCMSSVASYFDSCIRKLCKAEVEADKKLNPYGVACPGPARFGDSVRIAVRKHQGGGCPRDVY